MSDEQFLTTEEIIDYLQVNLRTVYRLIKAGKLPAVRVGRQWRFRRSEIDAWLGNQQRHGSPTSGMPGDLETSRRPRVLVVDDEASIRDLLTKTLALADYDVDVAPDGPSALHQMAASSYDLLITDLRMPGTDGMTVIVEARRRDPKLPVVIVTGYPSESTAIEAVNLGVSGYLTKPFTVPSVLDTAARALTA